MCQGCQQAPVAALGDKLCPTCTAQAAVQPDRHTEAISDARDMLEKSVKATTFGSGQDSVLAIARALQGLLICHIEYQRQRLGWLHDARRDSHSARTRTRTGAGTKTVGRCELMLGYQCPGCGHYIGLLCIADQPSMYRCPRNGRVYGPQEPIRRIPPKRPAAPKVRDRRDGDEWWTQLAIQMEGAVT